MTKLLKNNEMHQTFLVDIPLSNLYCFGFWLWAEAASNIIRNMLIYLSFVLVMHYGSKSYS